MEYEECVDERAYMVICDYLCRELCRHVCSYVLVRLYPHVWHDVHIVEYKL